MVFDGCVDAVDVVLWRFGLWNGSGSELEMLILVVGLL